jgi:hypothetical protein
MVIIYERVQASQKIQEAIEKGAVTQKHKLSVFEPGLADKLGVGLRTLHSWKTPSEIPSSIDDATFFALIYYLLDAEGGGLQWLTELLLLTSVPIYLPLSNHLFSAYMRQVRIRGALLSEKDIYRLTNKVFLASQNAVGLRGVTRGSESTVLQTLVPLEPEHRNYIRLSSPINIAGLTLYRYIESYIHDFVDAARNGAALRVVLIEPNESNVFALVRRSTSGTTIEEQRSRIYRTIDSLSRIKRLSGSSSIQLRLVDYPIPYGITVYNNPTVPQLSICQVRLYTFKTPTPSAPTILTTSQSNDGWFEFFVQQFDSIWEASSNYSI